MDAPGGMRVAEERETLNQVARVAQMAAQMMLGNGGETYRAEETARHICRAFGYESEAIAFRPESCCPSQEKNR
jgi:uncharacterized membrane protein YjjP (DUF1212 family)